MFQLRRELRYINFWNNSKKMDKVVQIKKDISKLKNPAKAKVLAGFFKTGKGQYAEGDKFLGIMVPQIRVLVKKYADLEISKISEFLHSEFHEEKLFALLILVLQFQKGDTKKQKEIYDLYLKNTKYINNWDLVDLTADKIVGAWLENKSHAILFKLAQSKSLWERRIAILATFHFIKNGKSELTLQIAEKLLGDQHDLIHKAVGWMLREVGKRCSQKEEEKFLQKHAAKMPRTMLRYAIERFDEDKRKYYLNLYK